VVTYELPFGAAMRKPMVIFASVMAVVVAAWAIGTVELKFSSTKK
jgi:hypothetical protein